MAFGVLENFVGYLHLLDSLNTRLYHSCLLGISLESGDESLNVLNLVKLVGTGSLLVAVSITLGLLELIEVSSVVGEFFILEVNDFIAHSIQKVTGVRHDDNGDRQSLNVVFEPDKSRQVQVICRFVQHQNLGFAENNLGDSDTHSPATREFF